MYTLDKQFEEDQCKVEDEDGISHWVERTCMERVRNRNWSSEAHSFRRVIVGLCPSIWPKKDNQIASWVNYMTEEYIYRLVLSACVGRSSTFNYFEPQFELNPLFIRKPMQSFRPKHISYVHNLDVLIMALSKRVMNSLECQCVWFRDINKQRIIVIINSICKANVLGTLFIGIYVLIAMANYGIIIMNGSRVRCNCKL